MALRAARSSHQVGRLIARVIARLDGWCPIRASEGQDPAHRATLLLFRWARVKSALTFLFESDWFYAKPWTFLPIFTGKIVDRPIFNLN